MKAGCGPSCSVELTNQTDFGTENSNTVERLVETLLCLESSSCWKNTSDQKTILRCALGVRDCDATIQKALKEGAVRLVPQLEVTELIDRKMGHHVQLQFQIAKRLLRAGKEERIASDLFCQSRSLLLQDHTQHQNIVALCLQVGRNIARASQVTAAVEYLELGIWLIENSSESSISWWKDKSTYSLTLSIYSSAAEANQAASNTNRALELVGIIELHGKTVRDKLTAYASKITILGQAGGRDEARQLGVTVLKQLRHPLPLHHNSLRQILLNSFLLRVELKGRSKESILRLPEMTEESVLDAMRVLHLLMFQAIPSNPLFMLMISLRMARLTMRYGLCVVSAPAFAAFGVLLGIANDPKRSAMFVDLALELQKRYGMREWLPRTYTLVYGVSRSRSKESIERLQETYEIGLETGDFEFALLARHLQIPGKLFMGSSFPAMIEELSSLLDEAKRLNQNDRYEQCLFTLKFFELIAHNEPSRDKTQVYEDYLAASGRHLRDCRVLKVAHEIWIVFMSGDHDRLVELAKTLPSLPVLVGTHPLFVDAGLFVTISRLILHRRRANKVFHLMPFSRAFATRLRKLSLAHPEWCSARLFLMKAEFAWTRGNITKASFYYMNAVKCCNASMERGVIQECYGRFFYEQQRFDDAIEHMEQARDAYKAMGAMLPADRMGKEIQAVMNFSSINTTRQRVFD